MFHIDPLGSKRKNAPIALFESPCEKMVLKFVCLQIKRKRRISLCAAARIAARVQALGQRPV
jgi:hypothetical protein